MVRDSMFFAIAALAALPALAQSPWYAGVAGGQSKTSRDLVFNRESTIVNATDLRSDFDAKDAAWKAFGGFRFNSVIAVEVSYADLGAHRTLTHMQGGDPPLPASIAIDRSVSGYGIDLVATAPLGFERFNVFARVGVFQARLKAAATLGGNIVFTNGDPDDRTRSTTQREDVMKFGIGAEWLATRRLAARLEWERYTEIGKAFAVGGSGTTGEADTDLVSLGVAFRF